MHNEDIYYTPDCAVQFLKFASKFIVHERCSSFKTHYSKSIDGFI